jgi:hypothetical protein
MEGTGHDVIRAGILANYLEEPTKSRSKLIHNGKSLDHFRRSAAGAKMISGLSSQTFRRYANYRL